ncbi:drug/metabolite transporter (DMT)-like permease [Anaerosolibacter carboniphilus]|uniref:Drug/metabolite transporter (DMT)-like permease n=1 Tax=Anaerosolibacter carboniphilus TaxID=1417629 RepID=A0A841KMF2_9FIRM|nr:DMT family transporter [Anaerosolibacter carboniphilus]MBB6214431.1 drug/metabolite transporter (DMT)-like permease [Anaerosolibacter carboniphilus]
MNKYRVWLLLIVCNLFWAGNYVFGKYVIAEITPLGITFFRWAFAILLLFPIAHFLEKPEWKSVRKVWPSLVIMGILGIIAYNMLLYSALDYTSPTNAAFVSALNPGIMVVSSVLLTKEKISRLQILGIGISLLGVLVLLTQGNITQIFHTAYNRGDLLMVGAVVVWTAYSILGRRLTMIPPITATAVSALFAVIMMAPFVFAQGMDISNLSPLAITGIIYMIIFPSVGSFVFWNISVREIGPGQAGIFLNLIPVFTAVISGILGERITGAQSIGGLFVFAGVYLTTGMLEKRKA